MDAEKETPSAPAGDARTVAAEGGGVGGGGVGGGVKERALGGIDIGVCYT